MGIKNKRVTLIATADWSQVNNRDGFRLLDLEIHPFLQRNKAGGWRLEPGDRLRFKVQIIDRKPEQGIFDLIEKMKPARLSINFCPALHVREYAGYPRITPFRKGVDFKLRRGLTDFELITRVVSELEPSSLFKATTPTGRPFHAKFKKRGNFDFMIGLAVDAYDNDGNFVARRRFRSDPEMDVGCSRGVCDPDSKSHKLKRRY